VVRGQVAVVVALVALEIMLMLAKAATAAQENHMIYQDQLNSMLVVAVVVGTNNKILHHLAQADLG
jgi:hypothetical protein